jgi:hypothetical protein
LLDELVIRIDSKTAAEKELMQQWVNHMLDEKVSTETRLTKNWATTQINKMREILYVPGVIAALGPGGTQATYPTYMAFVREIDSKMEKFDSSFMRMTTDI